MKPMLKLSIAFVTVGCVSLCFAGKRGMMRLAAQGRKPVTMYRFYTGKDGLSHVEKDRSEEFRPK